MKGATIIDRFLVYRPSGSTWIWMIELLLPQGHVVMATDLASLELIHPYLYQEVALRCRVGNKGLHKWPGSIWVYEVLEVLKVY